MFYLGADRGQASRRDGGTIVWFGRQDVSTHRSGSRKLAERGERPMGMILIIILVLLVIGALPTWPYSQGWGYYPGGLLGLILVIILILVILGRI
jgi:hypothetical protein